MNGDRKRVSFLPIGHMHEDIDQSFSSTYGFLRAGDAITLQDPYLELSEVYNKEATVCRVE